MKKNDWNDDWYGGAWTPILIILFGTVAMIIAAVVAQTMFQRETPMQMLMPLQPDMKKECLRRIETEFPDDMTEKEFWDFVCMMGANQFGPLFGTPEGRERVCWDMMGSFELYMENRYEN